MKSLTKIYEIGYGPYSNKIAFYLSEYGILLDSDWGNYYVWLREEDDIIEKFKETIETNNSCVFIQEIENLEEYVL